MSAIPILARILARPLARSLPSAALAALALIACLGLGAGLGAGLSATAAPAQTPPPAADASTEPPPRARIDAFRADLDQAETTLASRDLSDADLQRMRERVEPALVTLRGILDRLAPKADAVKARLDQLGPKPDDKAPAESADVARERDERQKEYAEATETLRIGRSLQVQAEQLATSIADRRRALFASQLFKRSSGLLSPDLWLAVAESSPRDLAALRTITGDWLSGTTARFGEGRILALIVALVAAIGLYGVRARLAPRFAARESTIAEPTRLRRALVATGRTLASTLPAVAAGFLIRAGMGGANLLPLRIEPIIDTLLAGLVFVAFARSLGDAILAPGRTSWRLINVSDATAERLYRLIFAGSAIIVAGKVTEATLQAIGAALQVSVAIKGVFALLLALLLADTLRRIQNTDDCAEESFGPYVPTEPTIGGPLRMLGWIAVAVIIAAALVGYVVFAAFLVDQIVWITVVATLLMLSLVLIDEAVNQLLAGESRFALVLQSSVGLRKRSLQQIAVLISGFLRLTLIIAAGMLVLAPWGVESADLLSSLRAAFFGFRVGDVTISLSTVAFSLVFFLVGLGATRAIQRWLEVQYLPATQLDVGLRNSIKTGFGYLGFGVAAALAFSQLGLSLDRIAIVAGALSVGIGFGLQSIVNNFVSGLILLWERPIKVGDWVVVGSEQGYVRRINVRSTEIETFDRASVIVPNSNLISGVVKNWVHNNKTGRITIPVTVAFMTEPEKVEAILLDCARRHKDVLKEPKPSVFFNKFSDTSLEFELRCFIGDVETSVRVKSELHFAIFTRLKHEKIYIAAAVPKSEVQVNLPGRIEDVLASLVESRAAELLAQQGPDQPPSGPRIQATEAPRARRS